MNVLILAGGRGKRFNALTKKVPKHFLKVLNKPLIFYILDDILRQGFNKIELSLNYKRRFFIKQLKLIYGKKFTAKEIKKLTYFQEKYHQSKIIR